MKTLVKTGLIATVLISMISCKENAQEANSNTSNEVKPQKEMTIAKSSQEFTDEATTKMWNNYLQLKTALVASDVSGVQKAAATMIADSSSENGDMKNTAQQIADTDDLETQRELFVVLTEKAGPVLKDAISNGTIYKQFCPMAFNNTGGYWYSDVAEIRNPYFGDRMLKCGSVKEKITKE